MSLSSATVDPRHPDTLSDGQLQDEVRELNAAIWKLTRRKEALLQVAGQRVADARLLKELQS